MDPLSDVLALLKPHTYMSAGFDAGGSWAVRFPDQTGTIKSGAVVKGRCWLTVDGASAPVRLETGDSFLLPGGRRFELASDLAVDPTPAIDVFPRPLQGGIVTHQGGGDCFIVSSRFTLQGRDARFLLSALPLIVHITAAEDGSVLRSSNERMMQELGHPQPGSALVIQHLAQIVLVEALRIHLARGPRGGTGWLSALADRRIGASIEAMHRTPAERWTLDKLAGEAGMSRSVFALVFKEMVGETPMNYLTRWRMLLAADRLSHSAEPVAEIALSLGYESESAFSTAFKRVMGYPPRQARSGANGLANLQAAE